MAKVVAGGHDVVAKRFVGLRQARRVEVHGPQSLAVLSEVLTSDPP